MGVGKAVRVATRSVRRVSHTAPAVHTVTHTVSQVSHLPSSVGLVSSAASSVPAVSAAASSTSATAASTAARQAAVAKARQRKARQQSKQIDKHRADLEKHDPTKLIHKGATQAVRSGITPTRVAKIAGDSAKTALHKEIKSDIASGQGVQEPHLQAIYQQRISPEGMQRAATRRFQNTYKQAKKVSGLPGPVPKVKFSKKFSPHNDLAFVTGNETVHLGKQATDLLGAIRLPGKTSRSTALTGKRLALHESAHVGQFRAGDAPGAPVLEGQAEQFSKLTSKRLGIPWKPTTPAYKPLRHEAAHSTSARYTLDRQFHPKPYTPSAAERKATAVGAVPGRERISAANVYRRAADVAAKAAAPKPKAKPEKPSPARHALSQAVKQIPSIGNSQQVAPYVVKEAKKHGLPPSVLMAQIEQESGFDPLATEHEGATISQSQGGGETQFIPSTAKAYGVKYGGSRKDIKSQIRGQAEYMGKLLQEHGSVAGALGGYYGAADSAYVQPILSNAAKYRALDRVAGGKIKGATAPKKLPGPWSGSRTAVAKGLKGVSGFKGGKRTPAENASVGGSPTSDHLTTNKAAYAKDIPATGSQGTAIAHKVASNLGIKNLQTGTYNWYTSPKAPGYRFQILWQVEGHFDHVHVGAEYVGAGASSTSVPGGSTSGVATATAGRGAVSPSAATGATSVGKATSQTEAARTRAKSSAAKKQGKLISSYISKPGQAKPSTVVPLASAKNFAGKTTVRRRTSLGL